MQRWSLVSAALAPWRTRITAGVLRSQYANLHKNRWISGKSNDTPPKPQSFKPRSIPLDSNSTTQSPTPPEASPPAPTPPSQRILGIIPDSSIPRIFTKPIKSTYYSIILTLVSGFLALHIFWTYFYSFDPTYGISMMPTIASWGDGVVLSKRYRRGRGVKVGDVVSFKHPVHEGEEAVKRIVGLQGDFVLMNTPGRSDAMIQIPQGHCWVVGDNLAHSRDSRAFGPLPMALLKGKVVAIVRFNGWGWPTIRGMGSDGLQDTIVE